MDRPIRRMSWWKTKGQNTTWPFGSRKDTWFTESKTQLDLVSFWCNTKHETTALKASLNLVENCMKVVPKSRWIITTRQRSCGKVMFSVMSVHGGGGSPMWCTDALALDLTVQHPPRSLGPAPLDIGTSLYSDPLAPAPLDMGPYCKGPCWRHLVTKTEDLFKLVHLRTLPPTTTGIWYWERTYGQCKWLVRILLECFLGLHIFNGTSKISLMEAADPEGGTNLF